jgi:hypothetical protein
MKAKIPNLTPQQKAQILGDDALRPVPNASAGETNPLAGLHTLCTDSPRRLISLWDMIPFRAHKLYEALLSFERTDRFIDDVGNGREQEPVNVMFCKREIAELRAFSSRLNLIETHGRVQRFGGSLDLCEQGHKRFTAEEFFSEIAGIREAFAKELAQKQFAFIPTAKACYFERCAQFGRRVNKQFPTAAREIKEAGNCLAADLNTAAVFHLMRIVEYGLRALAKDLGVRIPKKPLELAGWDEIIVQIGKKVEIKLNPPQPAGGGRPKPRNFKRKAEDREFYRGVIGQFYEFKDVFRNRVMHARGTYDALTAQSLFGRVRDFMRRLAVKLSEV